MFERKSAVLCKELLSTTIDVQERAGLFIRDAFEAARQIQEIRRKSLNRIHLRYDNQSAPPLDRLESLHSIDVQQFQKRFAIANVPCLIEDAGPCFDTVSRMWRNADGSIKQQWFRDALPHDAWLPVSVDDSTDIRMTILEWLSLLKTEDPSLREKHYLKDWHFLNWMYEYSDSPEYETNQALYQVPGHFQYDFLNNYHLVQSRHMADYRFVYWGPAGSVTTPHTDVLNSFSWSYNVSGTKEWTVFIPPGNSRSIKFLQTAGQLVFIPSLWKHSVVNVEDTLSVNHNWVTAANLDFLWEGIQSSLRNIRENHGACSVRDQEILLREGSTLSVSTFFYMILLRGLELLQPKENCDLADDWCVSFELAVLKRWIECLLQDESIHLSARLSGMLRDDSNNDEAERTTTVSLDVAYSFVDKLNRLTRG